MINFILLLGFLLGAPQGEIPMKDKDAFIKEFDEVSKSTTSIRCNFIQKKYLSFSKEPLISEGKMAYENGNMRWDQTVPENYLMVITGNEMKIKENGEVTVHGLEENKYMRGLKEIMIGSMTGSLLNSVHFDYDLFENEKSWIVKLTPKKNRLKKMFSEVVMNFNRTTYRMQNVVLKEESGDYTQIDFINPIFNEKLGEEMFKID